MNKIIYSLYQFLLFKKKGFSLSPNRVLKKINKSQYWTSAEMKEYQLEKINNLLKLSKKSSKFYSKKYESIDLPLESLEVFNKIIPYIKKNDIIDNQDSLKTKRFTDRYKHSTSGSTGKPLSVYISEKAEVYRKAGSIRFRKWWGVHENERKVLLWRTDSNFNNDIISKIKRYFRLRYDINIYNLGENIEKHFENIEKFKPSYIRGIKSGVMEFAELLYKNNLKFKETKLKVVIVTSEVLFEEERLFIEKVMSCKVANEYGSADGGLFAYECPNGSLHIYEEAVYLVTGKNSNLYTTELNNDSMPLMNYRNDDEIEISDNKCDCGRNSRIIKNIRGRTSGYILKPDGSKINQAIIAHIFIEITLDKPNAIKRFLVIQRDNKIIVKIVPLKYFNEEIKAIIKEEILNKIHPGFDVEFELVDELSREKSGKLVYFIRE